MASIGEQVEVRTATGGYQEGTIRDDVVDDVLRTAWVVEVGTTGERVTAALTDVRPRAPPPPDEFVSGLEADAPVEACGTDGVWLPAAFLACKMIRTDDGRKCQCTVRMELDGAEAVVDEKCVRPRATWNGSEWVAAEGTAAPQHKGAGAAASAEATGAAAPPAVPAEPPVVHPVAPGAKMEVTSLDEGLIGSWYEVEVVRMWGGDDAAADEPEGGAEGKALVLYTAFEDQSKEWVDCSRLRPIPPPNPTVPTAAAWTRKLTNGDFVELNYEQGWWEVQYLSRAGANLSVLAVKYGKVHQVTASGLRPGWKCLEGGTWQYALGGVARPADEWAGILATKPASGKARSSLDPAVAAAHTANSPLGRGAASNPAAGGVVGAEGEVGSFKWGVAVEVMSGDDAAGRGCWVPGEVLRVMGGDGGADGADGADAPQQLLVTWLAECDPPNATTDVEKARPAAPPPPAGWAANLRPGEPLDLYHDGAWWEVLLDSRKGGKAKVADGPDDPLPREVRLSQLRPRYTWLGWAGGWTYLEGGREVHVPGGPAPRSHNLPDKSGDGANAEAGRSSKGRAVVKPRRGVDGGARADAGSDAPTVPLVDPERVPKVGELLEVEVAETEENGGGVCWKVGEVLEVKPRQRFMCLLNGDDDFIEEYGMEDEGKEWRKANPADIPRLKIENEEAKSVFKEANRLQQERELAEAAALAAAGGGDADAEGKKAKKLKGVGGGGAGGSKSVPQRFSFGMEVEVKGRDKGFEGSWYLAEVLSAKEAGACTVQYDGLYETPPAGQPGTTPVQETVSSDHLRPKPPATPPNWPEKLTVGMPLELRHDDGWWQVTYVSTKVGSSQLLVKSAHWGSQHLVEQADLRPGWRWSALSNDWMIKGAAPAGGGASRGGGRGKDHSKGRGRGRGRGA